MNQHIPKIIHITWKSKDILEIDHIFPRNCIQKLVNLAEGWTPAISDDLDVDSYLKDNLSVADYYLLQGKHMAERIDVWRLIKMYNEGGLYADIDRLCNISINDSITDDTKMLLPECDNCDFSQDFMCSAPGNPIFLETLKLNLERRRMGINNVYYLGPETYFHGVTKVMTGEEIRMRPGPEVFGALRELIESSGFMTTYRETPPYNTIIYRPENEQINFNHEEQKRDFYAKCNLRHWTNEW
jgi:hypothetical protein